MKKSMPNMPPRSELRKIWVKLHHYFRIRVLEGIESGKSEDGTGHNHSGASANRLYYHILSESVLLAQGIGETDCDYGNRNRRLKNLSDLPAPDKAAAALKTMAMIKPVMTEYGVTSFLIVCRFR